MARKKYTIDEHVASIIACGGPEGALVNRYTYDFLDEVIDEIHSKGELLDIRTYHFNSVNNIWNLKEGGINYELGREMTCELYNFLDERYDWSHLDMVRKITKEPFDHELIKYNKTCCGMLQGVYEGSPSKAVIDFLQNHTDPKIKEEFIDLRDYHFWQSPQNIWISKDKNKNFGLAAEATKELIQVLQERYKWTEQEACQNVKVRHFKEEPIKYGAILWGMFTNVYNDSTKEAIAVYKTHTTRNLDKDIVI